MLSSMGLPTPGLERLNFDVLSMLLLFVVALAGAYFPRYLAFRDGLQVSDGRNSLLFHLGNMLSGGVMLSAGFCHLLPDALPALGFSANGFPTATFLSACGFLLTLLADQIVQWSTDDPAPPTAHHRDDSLLAGGAADVEAAAGGGDPDVDRVPSFVLGIQHGAGGHGGGGSVDVLRGFASQGGAMDGSRGGAVAGGMGGPAPAAAHLQRGGSMPDGGIRGVVHQTRGPVFPPCRWEGSFPGGREVVGCYPCPRFEGGPCPNGALTPTGMHIATPPPWRIAEDNGSGSLVTSSEADGGCCSSHDTGCGGGVHKHDHTAGSSSSDGGGDSHCGGQHGGGGSSDDDAELALPMLKSTSAPVVGTVHKGHRQKPGGRPATKGKKRKAAAGSGSGGAREHDCAGHHIKVFMAQRPLSLTATILLAGALCIHSVLEGMALGAQHTMKQTEDVMVAIVAHKGLAAYALGASAVSSRASARRFWTIVAVFATATPLGVALGYAFSEVSSGNGGAIMSALASGTFLYVAVMEVIPKELADPRHRVLKMVALLTGFGLMSLLALWT